MIKGKRILVTGGTGSFGRMFVGEILKRGPKEVIVFSRDEDKQGAMRLEYGEKQPLRFVLGDVRDYRSVREAVRGVDVVIHAAALKWITEVEQNVWEGIKTNVHGAQNLIEAARDEGVEKVIALSTDKAVEPVNAYGMAKALQERLITTANLYETDTKTVFVSTRYGNVLGSRGSVVPLFRKLIDEGSPLTLTDKRMTRFMLTLKESVELVLKALEEREGGKFFVRQMSGHSILDLIEVMVKASGKKVKVKEIGIRPGEKIHEVLVSKAEAARTIVDDDYYIILPQIKIEKIEKHYKGKKRLSDFEYASNNTKQLSKKELHSILKKEGWL